MKKLLPILLLNLVISNLLNAQCPPNFVNSYQQFNFSENYNIDLADLDGDGDIDAFVSGGEDNAGNYDFVFLNDGNGYFQSNNQRLDQGIILESGLGDLDSDGDIDAVTFYEQYNGINKLKVWKNFGNGTFGFNGQISYLIPGDFDQGSAEIELIDLDLDGDLDLLLTSRLQPNFFILCNDGFGGFSNINNFSTGDDFNGVLSPTDTVNGEIEGAKFIQKIDYNHDGLLDFLIFDIPTENYYILKNNGNCNFSYNESIFDNSSRINSFDNVFYFDSYKLQTFHKFIDLQLYDFDNDGDIDILGQGYFQDTISGVYYNENSDSANILLLNNGNNNYDSAIWFGNHLITNSNYGNPTVLNDIDSDGDIDIIGMTQTSRDTVVSFKNDGFGHFTFFQNIAVNDYFTKGAKIPFVDIDNDGDEDIVYPLHNDSIYTLINDGNGYFNEIQIFPGLSNDDNGLSSFDFADLDNDGDIDLYQASRSYNNADNIFLNGIRLLNNSIPSNCANQCEGMASVIVTNSTPPYTYQWNDPLNQTTPIATGLCTGTYSVSVTDALNCNVTSEVTVEQGILPETSICVVSVDSTSTRNVVVWQKPFTQNIDFYSIYREITTNIYSLVGVVPYDSLSQFTDNTLGINPNVTSYRYKLSYTDTCGNESPMSNFHETIHLSTNLAPNGGVNLIWDGYEGIPLSYYRILRDSSYTNTWEVLDSVTNNVFIWTDANPPTNGAQYLIEVVIPYTCTSTRSVDHNTTRSNRGTVAGGGLSPEAYFAANQTQINIGGVVDFYDQSSFNPTAWYWYLPGGTPGFSTQRNPSNIIYNTAGNFDVTLVVQNSLGLDTLIKSEYIQVYTGTELYPECDFMASNNLIEEGNSINFLDLSENNPTSWTWFFEGADPSFSTQQNPTNIYYASPGYYNVTLIANNPSGSDTLTQTAFIEVYSQNEPIADFAASITEVAVGSSVDFVDITQNNPTSWTWFFPGGNPAVSVDENPSNIVYSTIGTFDVTLVTSNPSGTDTIIKTNYINVVDATAPNCDFIANNTTINQASSIDFADLTQNNPTSWTWLFPGGNPAFSTLQNPTNIAYDSVGTFDVTLIASNSNGNDTLVKENYIQVLSVALPSSDFMAGNTTIFEGETIDYIDLTQNNPTSWTWLFDGASPSISNQQNPLGVQYNTVGTFDVTLITVNDNGTDTIVKSSYITVIEDASPNCDFIASDTSFMGGSLIDFLDLSTNNPNSWTWFFEGGNPSFSTQQNPTQIVYENQGNYDVTLIAENSFGLDTITKASYIEVTSSVGINNNIEKEITIYPNPTENTITVDLASTQLPVQLSLTDLSGRIIQNLNAVDSKQIIDLSKLSKGIYIIKLSSSIIYKELKVIKN